MKILLILLALSAAILAVDLIKYYAPDSQPSTSPVIISSPTPTPEFSFIFAGDAMFGRAVYAKFHNDLKAPFENLGENFFRKDLAFVNLEGPIVANEFIPDTNPENLMMKFPPQTAEVLMWLGINTVGLGNNHTDNRGAAGLDFTREILSRTQITTVGDPNNSADISETFRKNNFRVALLAVNILSNKPDIADIIRNEDKNNDLVIVFPHWGEEYQTRHNITQETLAHQWIDAGADLVIGAHPHVIQDAEMYQGRPIFYSLGNFLFDQTFSQATQQGLVVSGKLSDGKLFLELLPIKSVRMKLEVLSGEEKTEIVGPIRKELGFSPDNIDETMLIEI